MSAPLPLQNINPINSIQSLMAHEIPLRAELSKRNLYNFLMEFWPIISNDPFQNNWHIEKICIELQKVFVLVKNRQPKAYDLLINVPPGTTKSTIVMRMFPVWAWVNDPRLNFITGTYGSDLSLELADDSRDIINSKQFEQFYPGIRIRRDHDLKSNYQISYPMGDRAYHGGKRYSTSSGGTITGSHGHIILIDDPIDPKRAGAASDANRLSVNEWIDKTLSTRKTDKLMTPTITIMQRLHQDDPSGHALSKQNAKIKHINLPGELVNDPKVCVKPKEWEKYYIDDLLDPKRLSREALYDSMTHLGQYGYAGQILQNPVPPGAGMFNVDKIVVVPNTPNAQQARKMVYYWDKAGTQGAGAFTAGVLLWEMKPGVTKYKYLIVKIKRGQWSALEREDIIKLECEGCDKRTEIWIEQEPGSGGKESAEGTIRNIPNFKVKADRPTGNKILRCDPFSVAVGRGEVAIVNGPWVKDYFDELQVFPFSKYKDQADSSGGAYNKLLRAKRAGGW